MKRSPMEKVLLWACLKNRGLLICELKIIAPKRQCASMYPIHHFVFVKIFLFSASQNINLAYYL